MATNNSWNNTINNAKGAITLNAGTNAINIGSDATANSINIATGAADKTIVVGNISSTADMTFLNGTGNIILDKSSATGSVTIGDGTANFTINIGRGGSKTINMGAFNTTTFDIRGAVIPIKGNIITVGHQSALPTDLIVGSPVTTSSTTIYSGSNGLTINIPNAVINMNSGTGTIGISNDAFNTTVNVGTGAGVKNVTVGSTNTTSALTLNSGSGGIKAVGVASVSVANKNYVTINTSTGALGSDSGPASSISITGDTGGALSGSSFTFTGGATGLSFGGSGSTETLTFAGITANGGVVNLGTDSTDNAINIGTVSSAGRTINIGNSTGLTSVAITSGSNPMTLNCNTGSLELRSGNSQRVFIRNAGIDIESVNTPLAIKSGTGTMSVSADDTTNILNIGTSASANKTVTLGSINGSGSTTIQASSGGLALTTVNATHTYNSGTGAISISNDAAATTLNIGTGAAAKAVTLGSTTSTSSTTVQSGSGALNITSTNGAIAMNSGTGTVSIGSDATAATYNFATGAASKTVTLGSTNTTSSLALKYGTADFTLASATGTVISALDTGEITHPLQPAFQAYLGTTDSNVTGDGTTFRIGSGNALTEVFDQNSDFNTNGTFTAPVTGKYFFYVFCITQNTISSMTTYQLVIQTTAAGFNQAYQNGFANNAASAFLGGNGSVICQMTAGDTCVFNIIVSGGTKTVEVYSGGANGLTSVGGYLVC